MSKLIRVKLKKISYGGSNVGPNFHVTTQILDQKTEIAATVRHGTKRTIDQSIFYQSCEQSSLPVNISIIEEDPLFDDAGAGQISIPISSLVGSQTHQASVEVVGSGWEKGKVASLTLDLEVTEVDGIRYASDADGKGWLSILLDGGTQTQIPYALKVSLSKVAPDREYFLIEEGEQKGKAASVRRKRGGGSFLWSGREEKAAVVMTFEKKSQKLKINRLGTFAAKTEKDPIPNGVYDIEIPVSPHTELGEHYLGDSAYAQTWFRIGHAEGRFLHCGRQSEGCITVTEIRKWTDIYNFLIERRKDSLSVGTVKVID